MLIKNIRIVDEIIDIENYSIDVFVDCENAYTVSIATTKNFVQKMIREKSSLSRPNELVIIVRRLTKEIITEALQAYAEDDGFWLKLHHFARKIDIYVFDQLQAQYIKDLTEFELLSGLEDLTDEINKLNKLDNAEKSKLTADLEKLSQLLDSEEEKTTDFRKKNDPENK